MNTVEVRDLFDRHARDFDRWFRKNRKIFISELDALRAAKPRRAVLDLGVGSGAFAGELGATVGVDISRKMLELSAKRKIRVVQADAQAVPVRDRIFDTVVVSFTMCFVPDVTAMLREAFRVLRKGGRLILGEVPADSSWGRLYGQMGRQGDPYYRRARFFTLRESLSLLRKAGFEIDSAYGTVTLGPAENPRIERAHEFKVNDKSAVGKYGFVCLRALKRRTDAAIRI